ncbi:MAG: SsrA-binding protein SmpB [Pseudobdellovibrionaceae bacterium]|nr:MAG: SsrA-binding protein SmpB [Pseudobdellovibrionaceae bacterium]
MKIISENKKARHDYEVVETFEAGVALQGSEVKSLRDGQCNLKDSYVAFVKDEAYLQNAHISVYKASSYNNHDPERLRKLLLHRNELDRLQGVIREKGLSCVPLKIYFKKGRVKLELALVRGKKHGDKRETAKRKDADREIQRRLKKSR